MNESETRREKIDPLLTKSGWGVVEGSKVHSEFRITAGRLMGMGRRNKGDIADYVLRYRPRGRTVLDIARLPEIDGPQIGQWYLLAREEAAQPSRLRLCWMSPLRTRAVLAHHDGFHQLALEAHEMLSMLHAGTLRHMEASRLMQTALAI